MSVESVEESKNLNPVLFLNNTVSNLSIVGSRATSVRILKAIRVIDAGSCGLATAILRSLGKGDATSVSKEM